MLSVKKWQTEKTMVAKFKTISDKDKPIYVKFEIRTTDKTNKKYNNISIIDGTEKTN
jgi:hypothetical protein